MRTITERDLTMPDETTLADDPWKVLTAAVGRLQRAEDAEPHADADAEAEYASELVALAARDLVRYVERTPGRRPVGWNDMPPPRPLADTVPVSCIDVWLAVGALLVAAKDPDGPLAELAGRLIAAAEAAS